MHYGTPYASGFGAFQNMIRWDRVEPSQNGRPHRVYLEAAPSFGGAVFGVYVNGVRAQTVPVVEGAVSGPLYVPAAEGAQSLQIVRQGHSSDIDLGRYARQEEAETSARATLAWTWPLEFLGLTSASVSTDSWYFSGVQTSALDAAPMSGLGSLDYAVTMAGAVATVVVSDRAGPLATGTGPANSTVSFDEVGASGIAGSVWIEPASVDESGSLQWRNLAAMRILRGGVSVGQVANAGAASGSWTEPDDLAAATYSYTLRTVSNSGVVSADSVPITVDLNAVPKPPTGIHYASGNYAALLIHWQASATAGATYNVYVQAASAPYLALNNPVNLPANTVSHTLPAQPLAAGIVRVLVRAVAGGVEERTGALLDLELSAAGTYMEPRPNTPIFAGVSILGAVANLSVLYRTAYEDSTPTHVQLFARAPDGVYDFTTPTASAVLTAYNATLKGAAISWPGTSGVWYVTILAATALGTQSETPADEIPLTLLATAAAVPAFTVEASRS